MGQLEDLKLFLKVAEAGSLSRAAREMSIAKSAVSRRLALLEAGMGTRLIDRAPGRWAVTGRGNELLARARALVDEAQALAEDFREARLAQTGPLTLSLPRDFGLSFLAPMLQDFAYAHPAIELRTSFEDRLVDLRHENFDAAVRITSQPPANVQAVRLGQTCSKICASPAYLQASAALAQPQDLFAHRILGYGLSARHTWSLGGQSLELRAVQSSNSGLHLRNMAVAGLGLTMLPDFLCDEAVRQGDLLPVLTEFAAPELHIYLCRAPNARANRRVDCFQAALKNFLAAGSALSAARVAGKGAKLS